MGTDLGFYLRRRLEWLAACVLHCAKLVKYNPTSNLLPLSDCLFMPSEPPRSSKKPCAAPPFSNRTPSLHVLLSVRLLLICVFANPLITEAKNPPDGTGEKAARANHVTIKKKSVNKLAYQRSPSEETPAEHDRRMLRECKGMHNAGACRGYTR